MSNHCIYMHSNDLVTQKNDVMCGTVKHVYMHCGGLVTVNPCIRA